MTKILNISQILVYYDFPEIFVAYDNVGTNYLCLLVSADNEQTNYISTAISSKRLSNFINGKVDLRDIFENPEIEQWLFFDQVNEIIEAKEWESEILPNDFLPDQGFIYQKQTQGEELILNLSEELTEETKTFIGYFVQVDVEKGTWRIYNLDDEKEYSGEALGHTLQGVTVETINYKLTCQEIMEELKVTEKEKTKYILQTIEKIE